MNEDAETFSFRTTTQKGRNIMQPTILFPGIVTNPKILGGKPLVQGTRIPVSLVLGQLASGVNFDELAQEYHFNLEQIYQVLKYAASVIEGETIYDLAS